MDDRFVSRRTLLKGLGAGAVTAGGWPLSAPAAELPELITEEIPSSGEEIPAVGMGTWQTFNVGGDSELRDHRAQILEVFFRAGGGMIDSSPMYGSSRKVVGYCLEKLGFPDGLFSADKVWTRDGDATREGVADSAEKWRVDTFDVMQVHNLLAWREHLETLQNMKDDGEVRYVGVTTSHGRRHGDLEEIMKSRDIDFVQLTYNLAKRRAEDRLLPLAADRGIGVIVNRPFGGGALVDQYQQRDAPLPDWAERYGISNWPQFLLKFIISHPAVTCAIPATTRVDHMHENMGAARGELPGPDVREKMVEYAESL